MYFVLEYHLVDDYLERRPPLRPAHLALARAASARGELRLAGALQEPPDRAFLVFAGSDASVAERFARADPYVENGLVRSWQVRPWTVVVGADVLPGPLAQVVLFARDLARMRAFYGETLGLATLDEGPGWVRLAAGGCALMLHRVPAEVAARIHIADPPAARSDAAMKLAFHAADLEEIRARLAGAGAPLGEPRRSGEIVTCDGLDPEGNVFQITSRS